MKKIVCLIIMLTLVAGFTCTASAETTTTKPAKVYFSDAWLTFDIYTGNGDVSVSIGDDYLTAGRDLVSFDAFETLLYQNAAFDQSNYTITENNGNTVITIPDEYLKTLSDGTYQFDAVFLKAVVPLRLYVITHKTVFDDAYSAFDTWTGSGDARIFLNPNLFSFTFETELFDKLTYKGKEVDRSNYSILPSYNGTYIILSEEYVKTLPTGEHDFQAEFLNACITLKLHVDIPENTVPTTQLPPNISTHAMVTTESPADLSTQPATTTPQTVAPSPSAYEKSPETGTQSTAAGISMIALSAGILCMMLLRKKSIPDNKI